MINLNGQSIIAFQYLSWISEKRNVDIQTAYNGGEKLFGRFTVDGYYETNINGRTEKCIIEINGCRYHACRICFPNDNQLLTRNMTTGQQRRKEQIRNAYLKKCADHLDIIWTCQIKRELRWNREMRNKFAYYRSQIKF